MNGDSRDNDRALVARIEGRDADALALLYDRQAWEAFIEKWPRSSHRGEAVKRLKEAREREEAAFAATTPRGILQHRKVIRE